MSILKQLLARVACHSVSADPDGWETSYKDYFNQWPENNTRYHGWKPASLLPAPKWAIKRAMKLDYALWPEPIDRTVFGVFFMEFVDLALHLPPEKYAVIEKYRKRRIPYGSNQKHYMPDPLLAYRLSSFLAAAYETEYIVKKIIAARDGFRRTPTWDPLEVDDNELDAVREIVVESTTDFATLIQEWRLYILSIGRDQYVKDVNGTEGSQ